MIYLLLAEYVLHKFLPGIYVVSSITKIVSLLKGLWFREAPFVSYITKLIAIILMNINKAIVESLLDCNLTQGTAKTSLGRFSKNKLTHSWKRPSVAAVIHKNLTLIIFFTARESLPTGNLLRLVWNTHFKHFPSTGSLK